MSTERVLFSDDVSIEDHARLVVFRNFDGDKEAIFIERYDDTEQINIYTVELFDKPSDSWIDEKDLEALNISCDSDYSFNRRLSEHEQYMFTSDLCSYYGVGNFDNYPVVFTNYNSFLEWLESRDLIEKSED